MPVLRHVLFLVLPFLIAAPAVAADSITGVASYRERIAMLPGVEFEAALEDITLADAPAVVIGLARIPDAGNPPYRFSIDYDPARIDPTRTYAVRAALRLDGELLFTTDTVHAVLTRGAPNDVDITMIRFSDGDARAGSDAQTRPMARPERRGAAPRIGAHGLRLPASFTGTLPCADCAGIEYHLDLWPDQVFHLRREWLGDEPVVRGEAGRWYADAARNALVLYGSSEAPMQFQITGSDSLRLLDLEGQPIVSDLSYGLESLGTLDPAEIDLFLQGEFIYFADAPGIRDCVTGRSYPVAQEEDYLALERAYLDARPSPGAPVLAVLDALIAEREGMEGGMVRSVVVKRFDRVDPEAECAPVTPPQTVEPALTDTYWRIENLGEMPVDTRSAGREPHLLLPAGEPSYLATVGCNLITGSYASEDEGLMFQPGPMTLMACPPPLDTAERALTQTLAAVAAWRIEGDVLELLDAGETMLARLRAVYLP